MKKILSALSLVILPFLCFSFDFDFYNNTDADILHIYAMPDNADRYTPDLLGNCEVVEPLNYITLYITVPSDDCASLQELWTLRCIDADGQELVIKGVPLTTVDSVSLEWSSFRGALWEAE